MVSRSALLLEWIPIGIFVLACQPEQVRSVSNVQRAVTQWPAVTSGTGAPHICLEYASPAAKLHDREVGLVVPVGEPSVEATYSDAESLAMIYSVSEIMQFGHAALYRLCEASGNQMLEQREYEKLFNGTLESVNDLIELQLNRKKLDAQTRLQFMRDELDQLDTERCAASRHDHEEKTSIRWANHLFDLDERREKLLKKIQDMAAESGVPSRVTAVREIPSAKEWDEYQRNFDVLKTCATDRSPNKPPPCAKSPEVVKACTAVGESQRDFPFCVTEHTFREICK